MNIPAYKPIKQKYADYAIEYSAVTDKLIKRKRILLFTTSTAQEWIDLADDFKANGGRANHAYCVKQAKLRGWIDTAEVEPEYDYAWQEHTQ
jgi:hypothetical protein